MPAPSPVSPPTPPAPEPRAEGRRKRRNLPVAVVLWDDVPGFESASSGHARYKLSTGDMVRVIGEDKTTHRIQIHPGLDVFLPMTTKKVEASGYTLPDEPAWVDKRDLAFFDESEAKVYAETDEPVTLGDDPGFSTLSFYERAMKNPDPVVHRVVGPRMVAILGIHEDYTPDWGALLRDRDPKIRAVTIASLRQRGINNSRALIEDLIRRVSELTQTKAEGETEAEVLSILSLLKESGHPRVRAALQGFADTWKTTQSDTVNQALQEILKS